MTDELNYAPAAGASLAPTTIRTPDLSLETGLAVVPGGDGTMRAYWAKPANATKPLPVILVLCEAFGLHAHIADVARRYALEGYLAIAPDLMQRQGDPMSFTDIGELVNQLLLKIPDAQVMGDIDQCVAWAPALGGDLNRLAVTGFCWGGRWAWLYAAHRPVRCAIPWYGIVDGAASGLFPDNKTLFPTHPVDVASELKAPVLGLYGGHDEAIALATVETMRAALAAGSKAAQQSQIDVFDEAGHAFFADYRDSYRPSEAKDAWARNVAWLAKWME